MKSNRISFPSDREICIPPSVFLLKPAGSKWLAQGSVGGGDSIDFQEDESGSFQGTCFLESADGNAKRKVKKSQHSKQKELGHQLLHECCKRFMTTKKLASHESATIVGNHNSLGRKSCAEP